MNQLNRGYVRDPYNEFIDNAASGMSTARYMAYRTVKQLEAFQTDPLADPALIAAQLALANLYAAITYDYLANGFDNFVIDSDRDRGGQAIGASNMAALYDSSAAAATRALALVPSANTAANLLLRGQILAVRARARYDKAVWQKLNPSGRTPADPLVNVQGAVDDATAALPLLGADGRFALSVVTGMAFGNCFLPSCTNSRREIAFNPAYGSYAYTTTRILTVNLRDPISGQPDPALAALMQEFVTGNLLTSLVVTGSRDMRLILAEAALARGNTAEFTAQINALRALNTKPAWTGAAGQPTARELLVHERRVNLYLQGRRLNDMYRFGVVDPAWAAQSDAAACPGSLFPIVDAERQSNPNVADIQPGCGQ
jgi:hypothetical protein